MCNPSAFCAGPTRATVAWRPSHQASAIHGGDGLRRPGPLDSATRERRDDREDGVAALLGPAASARLPPPSAWARCSFGRASAPAQGARP
eukprot:3073127-Pyramimonas_sp.AAC.1